MIDLVERRGQVGVQRPHPLGPRAFAGVVDRADRVLAATARAKAIRTGFEPGFPLGFQGGADSALMAAVRDHRDSEWPQLRTISRLGDVHPLDRPGLPRSGLAVHPHRELGPGLGAQRELPVDPGRRAASVALRGLPHAQQRVAPAAQHQLLQVPDRGQVPVPRRREDPLSQPPYVVLVGPPVDGVPVGNIVRRSVHHKVSNLPSDTSGIDSHAPQLTSPRQRLFRDPRTSARYPASYAPPAAWRSSPSWWFPVGFRPPASASWASYSRQRIPPLSRLAYRAAKTTRTPSGFPCSARMSYDRGGCLLYSGAAVSSRPSRPG
jgi:hypothetical protein